MDRKQQLKESTSEFSIISDLPPTEEVSDNELETLDEIEQDFKGPLTDDLGKQTSELQTLPQVVNRPVHDTYSQSLVHRVSFDFA